MRIKRRLPGWRQPERRAVAQKSYNNRFAVIIPQSTFIFNEAGEKERPIMIHRVCFGSIERFIGILTEHYAGKFPTWLAPVQVKVLPVSEKTMDYSQKVYEALRAAGVRAVLDESNEKIGYKIRQAQQVDRVPYMLVLGAKESEAGTVSVRDRKGDTVTLPLDEFVANVTAEIKERR